MILFTILAIEDERDRELMLNVYVDLYPLMKSTAYKIVKDYSIAEDMVHDAITKLIEKLVTIRGLERPALVSYISRTVRNVFPANTDDGAIELTEFNAHIYEIEPFIVSLNLPDGWSIEQWPLAGGYDFISVFSRLNFFNEKGECVGVVGYNIYTKTILPEYFIKR